MTFVERAAHLAGLAGWLLGWRPDEFWRATPSELAAILQAAAGAGESLDGVGCLDDMTGMDGQMLARMMAVLPD